MWGTSDFLGGLFSKRLNPFKVVTASQLGGLVAALAFFGAVSLWGTHGNSGFAPPFVWGLVAGVGGVIGLLCLYAALSIGTMGVVSPITAMGAIVPVVLGLARGDAWTAQIGLGLLVALAGAVLASGPELSGEVGKRPIVLACISAVGFGVALYCMDGGARHDLSTSMVGMRTGSLTLLIPLTAWLVSKGRAGAAMRRSEMLALPVVGTLDLTANLMFAAASSQGQVSIVSVLGSLYPVATLALAATFLHERLRGIQLVGVLATVVGVILVTV